MRRKICVVLAAILQVLVGCAMIVWIAKYGNYPSGTDTMGHLYAGDFLCEHLLQYDFFPYIDFNWFNGTEILRYQAPLPVYLLAVLQLFSGKIEYAYLLYVLIAFVLGAWLWLWVGDKVDRIFTGAFFGVLWFFLPFNLYNLFTAGNLPWVLCNAFLPLVFWHVYRYMKLDGWRNPACLMVVIFFMAMCAPENAMVLVGVVVVYMCSWNLLHHTWKRGLALIPALILPFFMQAAWLIAYLKHYPAITVTNVLQNYFYDLGEMLNPFLRIDGNSSAMYVGLSVFLLVIFGGVLSYKRSIPGFWTAFFIFVASSMTGYGVISRLPGGEYLEMMRATAGALAVLLFSLLLWNTLKKGLFVLAMVLLVIDLIPSLGQVAGYGVEAESFETRMELLSEELLIPQVKELTRSRAVLLADYENEAAAVYLMTHGENPIETTNGLDQGDAGISYNLGMINSALADCNYLYVFDRCFEMGDDSILIALDGLEEPDEEAFGRLNTAARQVGYTLKRQNENYLFFHNDEVTELYGTITEYPCIGIGASAGLMSLIYPSIEETDSPNLNDYTYDQLKGYESIYLAGFTYDDKEAAEELLKKLAQSGVQILIEGADMPANQVNHNREFLGVTCNNIEFENGFPLLYTKDGVFDCNLFPKDYAIWNTVYLTGLEQVKGYFNEGERELQFWGTAGHKNITFVGLGLGFHYSLTKDPTVRLIYEDMMDLVDSELPNRKTVPITVEREKNKMSITCTEDGVNTGIAALDSLVLKPARIGQRRVRSASVAPQKKNHFLIVDSGTTNLFMIHSYVAEGLVMMYAGLGVIVIYLLVMRNTEYERERKRRKQIFAMLAVCMIGASLGGCGYEKNDIGIAKQWEIEDRSEQLRTDLDKQTYYFKTEGDYFAAYMDDDFEKLYLNGVNIGSGKPGSFPGELAISKNDYYRWFGQIADMNCNVIRVYTVMTPDFYQALYEYNESAEKPLYLFQGIWYNEEEIAQSEDAYRIYDEALTDALDLVDIIHGKGEVEKQAGKASGTYAYDISKYVIGWILGIEPDAALVQGTIDAHPKEMSYQGTYLQTDEDANSYEVFMCKLGDEVLTYEMDKYRMQRPISWSNWPTADPMTHDNEPLAQIEDAVTVDFEHIQATKDFPAGVFAAYHVYPYDPEFEYCQEEYRTDKKEDGTIDPYYAYISELKSYHTMPVLMAEFGIPSSRAKAHKNPVTGWDQGGKSEQEQGKILSVLADDIYEAGYAGGLIFSWQDEWFKQSWNTMDYTDSGRRAFWHDIQTAGTNYGLLAFESGVTKLPYAVDGKADEWQTDHKLSATNKLELSAASDMAYLYLMIKSDAVDPEKEKIYVPIDVTPKSGAKEYEGCTVDGADFVMILDGKENSRVLVQNYYNINTFMYAVINQMDDSLNMDGFEDRETNVFEPIYLALNKPQYDSKDHDESKFEKFETGNLKYGMADPENASYDLLSDFCYGEDFIEVRIPWGLIGFRDPSTKLVEDDFHELGYFDGLQVDGIRLGVALAGDRTCTMEDFTWENWDTSAYHERLKQSYYILQDCFGKLQLQ